MKLGKAGGSHRLCPVGVFKYQIEITIYAMKK